MTDFFHIYEVWKKEPDKDLYGVPYPYCLVFTVKHCNNRQDIYNEMTPMNKLFIAPQRMGEVRALVGLEKVKMLFLYFYWEIKHCY